MSFLRSTVIFPFLLIYHLLTAYSIYSSSDIFTPWEPTCIVYQKSTILALILPTTIYVIQFCHEIFTMGTEGCPNFHKFYFPVTRELLKLAVFYMLSSIELMNFKQLAVFVMITNTIQLLHTFQLISPKYYNEKHKKFLQLYEIWINQDLYKNKYAMGNKKEMERLFDNIVGGEEMEKRESVTSYNSDETLLNQPISFDQLPSTFNFKDQQSTSKVQDHVKISSSPVDISTTLEQTKNSNSRKMINYRSCYDFVDKLYSVSPKNTYHLNTATAIAACDQYSGDQEFLQDDSLDAYPLAEIRSTNESIDNQNNFESFNAFHGNDQCVQGDRANPSMNELPFCGKLSIARDTADSDSIGRHSKHSGNTIQSQRSVTSIKSCQECSNKLIAFLNWFQWLLPPFLPIKKCTRLHSRRKETFPLLKQKLSTYHMERAFSFSAPSTYGSLEDGFSVPSDHSGNNYANFKYFISYYFDYTLEANSQIICIDPIFIRFGKLASDCSTVVLILDSLNQLSWNALSFFSAANVVISIFDESLLSIKTSSIMASTIMILTLFKLNFLNCENCSNYKLTIMYESLINLILILLYSLLLLI